MVILIMVFCNDNVSVYLNLKIKSKKLSVFSNYFKNEVLDATFDNIDELSRRVAPSIFGKSSAYFVSTVDENKCY